MLKTIASCLAVAALMATAAPAATTTPSQPPTAAEAKAFVEAAEKTLLELWIDRDRAQWVQSTHITSDTELLAAKANEKAIAATVELAKAATRYDGLQVPADVSR